MSESSSEIRAINSIFKHTYKTAGTYMTAVGTLLVPSVATNIIKVHQYSISALGTIAYNLMDSKPLSGGGTIDYGGYLNSGVAASSGVNTIVKPFIPWPSYLCATTTVGSALCLGTFVTAGALGTVYFQCIYTDADSS